jgi:hypothetical protein
MLIGMTKLEDIEVAVAQLSDAERAKLRTWLDELDEQAFDAKIARDGASGKLDQLEARALANLRAGRVREI